MSILHVPRYSVFVFNYYLWDSILSYMSETENIVIKGAKVNNLKNVTLEIPRGRLIVITGISGSGKSSLAFDTLFSIL